MFYELLAFTDVETFEVASDAFLTFKASALPPRLVACLARAHHRFGCAQELLTRHAGLASDFLLKHSDQFFQVYNAKLLKSENYVTRRQSLKVRAQ